MSNRDPYSRLSTYLAMKAPPKRVPVGTMRQQFLAVEYFHRLPAELKQLPEAWPACRAVAVEGKQ